MPSIIVTTFKPLRRPAFSEFAKLSTEIVLRHLNPHAPNMESSWIHVMNVPAAHYAIGGTTIPEQDPQRRTMITLDWFAGRPQGLFGDVCADINLAITNSKLLQPAMPNPEFFFLELNRRNCYIPGVALP